MILIVDASVAIKWFVREAAHEEALRLLDFPDTMQAPDLLAAEVTNIAWKKSRIGQIGKRQAVEIARTIRQGVPLLHSSAHFNERALELAFVMDHPVYDCLYLACAELVDGTLITADDRFRRAAHKAGFADRVRGLGG